MGKMETSLTMQNMKYNWQIHFFAEGTVFAYKIEIVAGIYSVCLGLIQYIVS